MIKYRYFHFYDPEEIGNLCPDKRQIAAMESWVQNKSERIQRRFARFKERVEQYWKLYPWLMCVAICATLMSCAHTQNVVPNDTVTQTKTQTKSIQRDSVYRYDKDSMSVSLRAGAHVGSDPACYPCGRTIGGQTLMSYPARVDTLVIEKWHEHWKDRWLTRIDTLTQRDTTTVYKPVEVIKEVKHVPGFYKWCTGLFWLLIAGVIGKIALKFLI